MNLLRKVLVAVVMAGGVAVPMDLAVQEARAQAIHFQYGPYATLGIAQTKLAELAARGERNLRSQYFANGPAGAGWYLVY